LSGGIARCSFEIKHLEYWYRQPVPVFAALVPVEWPVKEQPNVYLIDVTSQLLDGLQAQPGADSATLASDFVLQADVPENVRLFLTQLVPASAARLQCRNGIVASIPTLTPGYVTTSPLIPVAKFKDSISGQIRKTAAFSIIFLNKLGQMGGPNADFRKMLASAVALFGDDPHWENFMARALSFHADSSFAEAVGLYEKAIQSIQGDPNVAGLELWQRQVKEIEGFKDLADQKKLL